MGMISGIISGTLLLAALVAFPFVLRNRKRELKEIAELGSQLEERTKSLVEAVESLAVEEGAARPLAGETYLEECKTVYTKEELWEPAIAVIRGGEVRISMQEAFFKEALVSFAKEFSLIRGEEFFKIVKTEIPYEDVEETIRKTGSSGHFLTPPRYPLIKKGHAYAK